LDVIIAAIPFLVVVVGVIGILRGLLMLLRGDESLVPVLWSAVFPISVVLIGLGVQVLLVKWVRRHGSVDEYEAKDESSFL